MATIRTLETRDIRFPTSWRLDGSDAMNPDPDYSAAYVVLRTDESTSDGEPLCGYGLVFTIGRGNDVQAAAIDALRDHVVGTDLDDLCSDLGGFARRRTGDSQLRWLGHEKGVMHMAIGAVANATWDLASRRAGRGRALPAAGNHDVPDHERPPPLRNPRKEPPHDHARRLAHSGQGRSRG